MIAGSEWFAGLLPALGGYRYAWFCPMWSFLCANGISVAYGFRMNEILRHYGETALFESIIEAIGKSGININQ